MQTLLLLEDHAATARWLNDIAMSAFPEMNVVHAGCLTHARGILRRQVVHIALLDIHLPDGNGLDLIPFIRQENPDACLVMTTVFDDDQHLFDALRAGAHGYLLKEQSSVELVARLRGIPQGDPPLSPGVARRMLNYFRSGASACDRQEHGLAQPFEPRASHSEKPAHLSPRESEALTLLAKGYSIKEIAQLLDISGHTAAGYAKTLYRKLNISSRAEATLEASRLGLVSH